MKKNKFRKVYSVKRKKTLLKNRFFRLFVLLAIATGTFLYFLFFSPVFTIKNMQVIGNEQISEQDIVAAIKGEMTTFRGDNIFLFAPAEIKRAFLGTFPQVADINLQRDFPDGLKISIKERKPVAIFCQDKICFDLDKEGTLFESGATSSDSLPEIESQIFNKEVKSGTVVLSEDVLSQILNINERLKNFGVPAEEFSVVSEQRLNSKTSEGWEIYFNLKGDTEWQLTELSALLKAKIPSQKRKNLEYVDLRFDKVFIYPEIK
ncbi:MAG: hypothetical protein A2175_01045 [Candidatus Nealsonbacteria bacterium RBG_13_42_11]|uniref:POTRA domain-containing protein n=1 Tax=Candidatus Nealsonbacteria bacterium RBG_13_42_11 TaxID=1801663 RepID=A0A1G2DZR1_9BACT|nr:MAG: hypothetical protein A2175_01045 [Candidatus Nealsonbacteria bacterium RBG_13_42_11]